MPDRLVRARLYRQRAEELRTIAQDFINTTTMQTLAAVARDYETMAANLEKSAGAEGENTAPGQLPRPDRP